ncbi:hypothetical protein LX64_02285 [Chitinophaga skermanii]|uniref:Spi protease inhibitor domain-containing protein n=1 Tax=Chitinophaga skermanii TaxID=331697 RepID=A0A327QLD6_9BACT|nr:hypothetical protein [Chitinophaga skermanii]RAJ05131.1 hypothetical protein LX64_02285 [Chitinophaga skermanii]
MKLSSIFYPVLLLGTVLIACSKDDDDNNSNPSDLNTLYANSIKDAMVAEDNEVSNGLMAVTDANPAMVWKVINGQKYVLMATFMRFPGSYPVGDSITNSWGESWVFAPSQMKTKTNGVFTASSDTIQRVCQMLGLPPRNSRSNTHIAQVWVLPSRLYRPAGNPDITTTTAPVALMTTVSNDFKTWFDNYIIFAYYRTLTSDSDFHYPWTRLGYTYDWAPGAREEGCSEFVILPNSGMWVEKNTTASGFFK